MICGFFFVTSFDMLLQISRNQLLQSAIIRGYFCVASFDMLLQISKNQLQVLALL
jgi:hypothetical protein